METSMVVDQRSLPLDSSNKGVLNFLNNGRKMCFAKETEKMKLNKREQLEQARAQLYAVFARYPARRTMQACSCCVKHEEIVALTAVPLNSLSGEDLGRYAFKAMTTWGDSEDFRSF